MSEERHREFDLDQLEIRPAETSDLHELRSLFDEGCLEGQVPENDTGADIDNLDAAYYADDGFSSFWVASYRGTTVGMIGVQRHQDNVAEIRRLRVHPDYRRLGIGTHLMETAIGFCHRHSYLKVILDTRIEREPAIRLFEKFGFGHSRTREIGGRKLLDFYFDLYRDSEASPMI